MKNNFLCIHVAEARHATILVANGLSTRVFVGTILDVTIELLDIVFRDTLREGEIHGDLLRDTQLRNRDIGVRSDNGTGRELYTLTLDIVADTPLLAAKTLLDRLERTTVALSRRCHARNLVIDQRSNVILENIRPLINHRFRSAGFNTGLEILIICLNDLSQLVGEIILRTLVIVLDNGRADLRRRNGQNRADHPIRATPIAAQPHEIHILIRDTAEET
jgi:hypothetical protein